MVQQEHLDRVSHALSDPTRRSLLETLGRAPATVSELSEPFGISLDSTSIGTLVLPVWLMLAPGRLPSSRIVVFVATVAVAYLVLGVLLVAGALTVLDDVRVALDTTPAQVAQLIVGVGLFGTGLVMEPWTRAGKERARSRREVRRALRGPTRMDRWRDVARRGSLPVPTLAGLALTAVALEAVTMVPYLAAIVLLASASLPLAATALVLVGYCLVMIAPAGLLLLLRVLLADRLTPFLDRMDAWIARTGRETTAWAPAIIGLLIAGDAAQALQLGS